MAAEFCGVGCVCGIRGVGCVCSSAGEGARWIAEADRVGVDARGEIRGGDVGYGGAIASEARCTIEPVKMLETAAPESGTMEDRIVEVPELVMVPPTYR